MQPLQVDPGSIHENSSLRPSHPMKDLDHSNVHFSFENLPVTLHLFNLYWREHIHSRSSSQIQILVKKFKHRMRQYPKPFQMRFTLIHSLGTTDESGTDDNHFSYPSDVKVSYNHSCIIVCDHMNGRLQLFHLNTKKFMTSISHTLTLTHPITQIVEQSYKGCYEDAIIFAGVADAMYKFDLGELIEQAKERPNEPLPYIWKHEKFNCPRGITVTNCKVYVSDMYENLVKILDSVNGQLLCSMSIQSPTGVDFTSKGLLLIGQGDPLHCVNMFQHGESSALNDWKSMKQCGHGGEHSTIFKTPYSVVYDKTAKNFIVSDTDNNRIQILSEDGQLLRVFGSFGTNWREFKNPCGMTLNEQHGELMVCDTENHRIQIFQ
ncbi:hypothetical protein C9374_004027 [Naegleria lovaniensis]|uniref:Uncharacterized protein n=1 Tax=Naegleria lovaniensis TaxID=51637 RepID=A0AA88H080_NAELO|nr:uncharacterized protein C9374_004027 [Naegleria lovaniensis]KAG2394263.1 hypothetical protein C9374_004027 [Naegleria lovaniensis]